MTRRFVDEPGADRRAWPYCAIAHRPVGYCRSYCIPKIPFRIRKYLFSKTLTPEARPVRLAEVITAGVVHYSPQPAVLRTRGVRGPLPAPCRRRAPRRLRISSPVGRIWGSGTVSAGGALRCPPAALRPC